MTGSNPQIHQGRALKRCGEEGFYIDVLLSRESAELAVHQMDGIHIATSSNKIGKRWKIDIAIVKLEIQVSRRWNDIIKDVMTI